MLDEIQTVYFSFPCKEYGERFVAQTQDPCLGLQPGFGQALTNH